MYNDVGEVVLFLCFFISHTEKIEVPSLLSINKLGAILWIKKIYKYIMTIMKFEKCKCLMLGAQCAVNHLRAYHLKDELM
jgi:hypothetical protein